MVATFKYINKHIPDEDLVPILRSFFVSVHGLYLFVAATWWTQGYSDKATELAKGVAKKMAVIGLLHWRLGITQPLFVSCALSSFNAYELYLSLPDSPGCGKQSTDEAPKSESEKKKA